jgi:hypothetical protein
VRGVSAGWRGRGIPGECSIAGILTDRPAAALDDAQVRGEITIERAPIDSTLIEAVVAALGTWSTG